MEEDRGVGWAEEVRSVLALAPDEATELEPLWEGLWRAREGDLNEESVMGCLIRPRSQTLLRHYCSTVLRLNRERLLLDASHVQGEKLEGGARVPTKT